MNAPTIDWQDRIDALTIENDQLRTAFQETLAGKLPADLLQCVQEAADYMAAPTILAFGKGEVLIGIGTYQELAAASLRLVPQKHEVGEMVPAKALERVDRDSTILTFPTVESLDVLLRALSLLRKQITGDHSPAEKLEMIASGFVQKHQISCAEATVEDRVYEHAPELVEKLAEVVGYYRYPGDEDDEAA